MASLDELEGDVIEGTATLVAIVALVFIVLIVIKAKNLHWPVSWYPSMIANKFATWIDEAFSATPIAGGKIQSSMDEWDAQMVDWMNQHTPDPTKSSGWAEYVEGLGGQSGLIQTGTGMGNQTVSQEDATYWPDGSDS